MSRRCEYATIKLNQTAPKLDASFELSTIKLCVFSVAGFVWQLLESDENVIHMTGVRLYVCLRMRERARMFYWLLTLTTIQMATCYVYECVYRSFV